MKVRNERGHVLESEICPFLTRMGAGPQPAKEITKPVGSKKDHFKYESYKFSTIIKIIEQELSDKERKGLLKEFSDYLHRRKLSNLHYVKNNLIDSEITLKRHLYEFITSVSLSRFSP
jgi:hypothetical protein